MSPAHSGGPLPRVPLPVQLLMKLVAEDLRIAPPHNLPQPARQTPDVPSFEARFHGGGSGEADDLLGSQVVRVCFDFTDDQHGAHVQTDGRKHCRCNALADGLVVPVIAFRDSRWHEAKGPGCA